METKLAKWGNSVGLRLPREIVAQAGLATGDPVSIVVEKGGRIVVAPRRPRLVLSDLVRGITPQNLPGELEWGPAQGREAW